MSSGGSTQTVTSETDPDLKNRQLQLYGDAQQYLNNTAYSPYPHQATAGLDPMQQASQNMLSQGLLGQQFNYQMPQTGAPWQGPQFGSTPSSGWQQGYNGYTGPTVNQDYDPANPNTFTTDTSGGSGTGIPNKYDQDTIGDDGQPVEFRVNPADEQFLGGPITSPGQESYANGNPGGMVGGYVANSEMAPPAPPPPGFQPVGAAENSAAAQGAAGVMGYNPQMVQAGYGYQGMNPYQNAYENNVVGQGVNDIMRASQIQDQYRNQSGGAGTYGGDRQGIRESEHDRNTMEGVSRFVNQARSQGFDTAAQLGQQDANRFLQAGGMNQQAGLAGQGMNLAGANSLSGIGNSMFDNLLGGAGALNQMGTQNQMLSQDAINQDMMLYNQSQNAGLRDIGTLQSILQGMPVGMNQSTYTPGGSLMSGILGGGLGLLGSAASGGIFGAGGRWGG